MAGATSGGASLVVRDDTLYDVLKARRDLIGAIPGTLESWLALRGLRTLHLRVERSQANATELARRLSDHGAFAEVRYPGFGAVISAVLPPNEPAEAESEPPVRPRSHRPIRASTPKPSGPPAWLITALIAAAAVAAFFLLR